MATIEDIISGLIAFRDTTYSRLDELEAKIDVIEAQKYVYLNCNICNDQGKIPRAAVDEQGLPTNPIFVDCPVCGGTKKVKNGELKSV